MHKRFQRTKDVVMRGVDVILPPRCALTGDMVDAQGMISAAAWAGLDFITEPFCDQCGIPFDFEYDADAEQGKCLSCIDFPPPFRSARAPLIYNDISRDLILGFKHGDKTHMVRSFVPWLRRSGAQMLAQADYLIPVPLHRRRLIARRYNQAAIIADALSKASGVDHLPMALRRTRSTPSQGHLKTDERAKNVRRAFDVDEKYAERLKGSAVILIDDVYTTGATAKECAKTLIKGGAARVDVLTIARVLKE